MKLCYVDESGCTGQLKTGSDIQPVLVFGGMIVDSGDVHEITDCFLHLKQRFFPGMAPVQTTHMGWMLKEIKGAELRRDAAQGNRNNRRHAFGFLSELLRICDVLKVRFVGRVWVKAPDVTIKGVSIYTSSLQSIYADFQDYLMQHGDHGFVVVDSRLKHLNTQVAHSIFTQKFKSTGDPYDRIAELPGFSHSDNHACLQIVDIMCSALMTPIAIHTYCEGHVSNLHVRPEYKAIKQQFAEQCRLLQHRYRSPSGKTRGGFVVSDPLASRPGGLMFRT